VYVLDISGSMGGEIEDSKNSISQVAESLAHALESEPNGGTAKIAVVAFSTTHILVEDFQTVDAAGVANLQTFLNNLSTTGSENMSEALFEISKPSDPIVTWRPSAQRQAILIGDEPIWGTVADDNPLSDVWDAAANDFISGANTDVNVWEYQGMTLEQFAARLNAKAIDISYMIVEDVPDYINGMLALKKQYFTFGRVVTEIDMLTALGGRSTNVQVVEMTTSLVGISCNQVQQAQSAIEDTTLTTLEQEGIINANMAVTTAWTCCTLNPQTFNFMTGLCATAAGQGRRLVEDSDQFVVWQIRMQLREEALANAADPQALKDSFAALENQIDPASYSGALEENLEAANIQVEVSEPVVETKQVFGNTIVESVLANMHEKCMVTALPSEAQYVSSSAGLLCNVGDMINHDQTCAYSAINDAVMTCFGAAHCSDGVFSNDVQCELKWCTADPLPTGASYTNCQLAANLTPLGSTCDYEVQDGFECTGGASCGNDGVFHSDVSCRQSLFPNFTFEDCLTMPCGQFGKCTGGNKVDWNRGHCEYYIRAYNICTEIDFATEWCPVACCLDDVRKG